MWWTCGKIGFVLIPILIGMARAQMATTTTTTTTQAPMQGNPQNVTVNPVQVINFSIPGQRLLRLFHNFRHPQEFMGRCLGYARKLKMLMPFFIFKLGVIMTTLGFLTLFSLKSLAIGVALLIMNAAGWLGRISGIRSSYPRSNPWASQHSLGRIQSQPTVQPTEVHLHVHKDHRNDGYTMLGGDGYNYGSTYNNDKHNYGGGGGGSEDYDTATTWRDRISKGLRATRTLGERIELINLYTRLGFDVNQILSRDLEASGVRTMYPRRVLATDDPKR